MTLVRNSKRLLVIQVIAAQKITDRAEIVDTLKRAGFDIAPLQSPWLSTTVPLDQSPLGWDLTLLLADGTTVVGADVYRHVMRRVWWAYPLYVMSVAPGLDRIFNWSYRTFARNRYCVSRACGLHAPVDRHE